MAGEANIITPPNVSAATIIVRMARFMGELLV
jgi:hypothetical protein